MTGTLRAVPFMPSLDALVVTPPSDDAEAWQSSIGDAGGSIPLDGTTALEVARLSIVIEKHLRAFVTIL
jgi:hypothetical protein